jgi:5-oxoprolinase (ATP-hydrolysing)
LLEPGDEAVIDNRGNIIIEVAQVQRVELEEHQQAVNVSVFHSLFASVAEQMGRTLQRTSVSTNIRERLDFSCAIFDAKGNLVSNAPHIPVHLGSMSSCVRYLRNSVAEEEQQNRVFITNHPAQGGSHLPDITIITPVFHDGRICYYLANRGHHADIGGISPGSMPSNSRYLSEEGAVFSLFPVVEKNGFQGEKVAAVLQSAGARNIERNLSDIKAQISANQRGKSLLERIMPLYGRQTVLDYMEKIQQISKNAVLDFFRKKAPLHIREAEYMDSGMRLAVEIRFLPTDERVVFDFSQSSVPLFTNNQNAPEAITNSVLVYVLRLLLNKDLPLNDGFLQAVEIIHQRGSILSPLPESAVAGGNVTTSQRLVDLLLKAFRLCAASQGCMNNLSFGNKNFGYYETIGGGAGAGPGFHGADAVHTHMTNTRSTDPEIMELNYPLILRRFAFRQDSRWGNSEKDVPAVCVGRYYSGGVGIEKEIEFLEPVHISLLTERRVTPPFGLNGAPPGRCGENLLLRGDQVFFLGGRAEIDAQAHDRLLIRTPSGGCYLA